MTPAMTPPTLPVTRAADLPVCPPEHAWLIQDLPASSTLTDAQYVALRHCDFWDSVTATQ